MKYKIHNYTDGVSLTIIEINEEEVYESKQILMKYKVHNCYIEICNKITLCSLQIRHLSIAQVLLGRWGQLQAALLLYQQNWFEKQISLVEWQL
jgi:hypothetical protein